MTYRRILLAVLVLVAFVLVPAGGVCCADEEPAPAEGGAAAGEPTSARSLGEALDRLARRVEDLLAQAERDPRYRLIDVYTAYTRADFANSRRPVKAKDLVLLIADGDAPKKLREAAAKALASEDARKRDPDFVLERGAREPRKHFFRQNVTKLLIAKDVNTRRLGHQLLITFFDGHKNDAPVVTYDPVNGSSSDWRKTYNHWRKILLR